MRFFDWFVVLVLVFVFGVLFIYLVLYWSVDLVCDVGVEVFGDVELFCWEWCKICLGVLLIVIIGMNGKLIMMVLIVYFFWELGFDV